VKEPTPIDPASITAEYQREVAADRQRRLDEFARAALTGLLSRCGSDEEHPRDLQAVSLAYVYAEDMLAESDRRTKEQA